MTNKTELNIDVNLTVSKETAERAVSILNMYLQDTGTEPFLQQIEYEDRRPFWRITL